MHRHIAKTPMWPMDALAHYPSTYRKYFQLLYVHIYPVLVGPYLGLATVYVMV